MRPRAPLRRLALLAVAVTVLAGCTREVAAGDKTGTSSPALSSRPGDALTSRQMAAVVAATMAANNRANRSVDLSLLRSYEGGSALAIDAASYAEAAKGASSACAFPPFGFKVLQAAAFGGDPYPRRFVVLGSSFPLAPSPGCTAAANPCPSADSLFVFERESPREPWKIVLEPAAPTGRVVTFEALGVRVSSLTASAAASAQRLPAEVAAALRSYEQTGRLGALRSGEFKASCFVLPDPRAALEQYRRGGVTARQIYSPDGDELPVPLAGGGVLSLFTLDFVTTLVPSVPESTIEWISDPSAEPVTGLLATGQYVQVVEHGALELAVVTGRGGDFTIIGAYSGVFSVAGTKGSPGSGSGGGVLVSYAASGRVPRRLSRA